MKFLQNEIKTKKDIAYYITDLYDNNMMYHFDDDAEDILRNAISESEDGVISLSSVEEKIEDSIRESLSNLSSYDLFYGDEIFDDGGDGYYVVQRSNQIESFNQPDQYEDESNIGDIASRRSELRKHLDRDRKKYGGY
jgi:hypothetical protein